MKVHHIFEEIAVEIIDRLSSELMFTSMRALLSCKFYTKNSHCKDKLLLEMISPTISIGSRSSHLWFVSFLFFHLAFCSLHIVT